MNITQLNRAVSMIETPFGDGGVVFLYLLKGDVVALVDTGAAPSPKEVLLPALAEIGMVPTDVDLILNTHIHLDHSGGNREMKRASNAPIYIHSAGLPMARSPEAQVEELTAPLRALEFPAALVEQRASYVRRMAGEATDADVILSDGDTVDLGAGVKLSAVHTPGHTPGCTCFYWESEGLLITGDAVQGQGPTPGDYPLYFDASEYRRSLAALAGLDARTLCLGHTYFGGGAINPPIRLGADARAFLRTSILASDSIHEAVVDAIGQTPGASRRQIVLATLSRLIYKIPQVLVRETGMPRSCGPTLGAHIDSLLAGTYPL